MKNLTEQEIRNELTRCGLKQLNGTHRYTLDEKLVFEATESLKILFHVVHQSYSGSLSIEFCPKENFMESVALLLFKYIPDDMLDKPRFPALGWVRFLLKNKFQFSYKYRELMSDEDMRLKMKNGVKTEGYKGRGDQTCEQFLIVEFLETNFNRPAAVECQLTSKISESLPGLSGFPFHAELSFNVMVLPDKTPMKTFDNLELKIKRVRELLLKSASKINFS